MGSSELPLGSGTAGRGVGRGDRAGRGQRAGPQGKEVPLARVPGRGTKLLRLYSGKQGLTVPVEPSPAKPRLGTTADGLSEHKMLVLLPLCKWLLPPGAQQVPGWQPELCGEQRGKEEGSQRPWEVELAFLRLPQLEGVIPGPQSTRVQER